MSLDRSLKTSGGMTKHRNVLTRPERIAKLKEDGRFEEGATDPIHLPKVGSRKVSTGKKKAAKAEEEA
jgi:small basic protein (TIGR04137 family)